MQCLVVLFCCFTFKLIIILRNPKCHFNRICSFYGRQNTDFCVAHQPMSSYRTQVYFKQTGSAHLPLWISLISLEGYRFILPSIISVTFQNVSLHTNQNGALLDFIKTQCLHKKDVCMPCDRNYDRNCSKIQSK